MIKLNFSGKHIVMSQSLRKVVFDIINEVNFSDEDNDQEQSKATVKRNFYYRKKYRLD